MDEVQLNTILTRRWWMDSAMASLSDRISERFLVPRMFLSVVAASSRVDRL